MLPENAIPNSLGISTQGSANMMSGMGDMMAAASPPPETPTPETNTQQNESSKVAAQFRSAWGQLEDLHGNYGGDSDKFRTMQKAVEDWFADLAPKIQEPSNSPNPTGY